MIVEKSLKYVGPAIGFSIMYTSVKLFCEKLQETDKIGRWNEKEQHGVGIK